MSELPRRVKVRIGNINEIFFLFLFQVETDYVEEEVALSRYHLSAALACAKVCSGFEEAWDIK